MGERSVCQKCANSALKQSDSVAKSNTQGINRILAEHWCRPFFQHTVLYIQGTKEKVQGPHILSVTASSVWSKYRIFGQEFYKNHIFHHVTAFTFSFTEFPVQPQLVI